MEGFKERWRIWDFLYRRKAWRDNAKHINREQAFLGENCNSAKFKEEDIIRMRELRSQGKKLSELAKEFGIDQQYVSLICTRKVWKHI